MTPSTSGSHHLGRRKATLMIVDDHPIIRRGLAELLAREPDLDVCGGADNVADAVAQIEALHPDLVIVDMSLKESHGIDLIGQIHDRFPGVKTLVWSMFDERVFAERALRAGAMGYVNKKEPIENVVHAVRQVLDGEMCLSPQMTHRLVRRACGGTVAEGDPIGKLSDREIQVFEMIGRGMTTKQIARQLDLSPKTIEAHREKIKTKLDLSSAAALSRRAILWILENG